MTTLAEAEAQRERKTPKSFLLNMEGARATAEFTSLAPMSPVLRRAPKGDGHPVLVLPGMLGGDESTLVLRRFLRSRDYWAHRWHLGRNLGRRSIGAEGEHVLALIERLYLESGERPVSLVGWSLGGIIAREAAKRVPDQVRQVITMGSPFNHAPEGSLLAQIYHFISGDGPDPLPVREALASPPEGIPSTAIYSRSDGMVSWRACLEGIGPMTDNIEVYSSHAGYGVNPSVLFAVADRLALPQDQWAPFDRSAAAWRRLLYPKPAEKEVLPDGKSESVLH